MKRMEYVKELLKQTLKNNKACCCAKDATFECRNCQLVGQMTPPQRIRVYQLQRGRSIDDRTIPIRPCPNDMKPGDLYRIVDDGPCRDGRRIRLEKVSKRVKA